MKKEENEIIPQNEFNKSLELNIKNKSSFEKEKSARFLIIHNRNLSNKDSKKFFNINRTNIKISHKDNINISKIQKFNLKKSEEFPAIETQKVPQKPKLLFYKIYKYGND